VEKLTLAAPEPLTPAHELGDFCCGDSSLDDWLKRRAHQYQISGASRTYVVAEGRRVAGYYCLACGALALNEAPSSVRRNMPDPAPMAILGRLAVDETWRGKGLGAALLQDAFIRTKNASGILGIRGLLVQVISHEARVFYEHRGSVASPAQPMTLVLSLKDK